VEIARRFHKERLMPIPSSIRPDPTPPSNRADARRNHDRLLDAANEVFDERGVDASLDEIARRAGVGSGTLYRHFPTRDALMSALFWERIETLCAEGDELMAAAEPTEALILWVRKLIGLTMRQGLAQALVARQKEQASALFDACRRALDATGTPLLDRA
jgi:AcrR family transcriptional regulator